MGECGQWRICEGSDWPGKVVCIESNLTKSPLALSVDALKMGKAEAIVETAGLKPELVGLGGVCPEDVAHVLNLNPGLFVIFAGIQCKTRRTWNEVVEEGGQCDARDGLMAGIIKSDGDGSLAVALAMHFDEGLVVAIENRSGVAFQSLTAGNHGKTTELGDIARKAHHAVERSVEASGGIGAKEDDGERVHSLEEEGFPDTLMMENCTNKHVMAGGRRLADSGDRFV